MRILIAIVSVLDLRSLIGMWVNFCLNSNENHPTFSEAWDSELAEKLQSVFRYSFYGLFVLLVILCLIQKYML